MRTIHALSLAACATLAPVAAQQVCVRGLVEKGPAFSICVSASRHQVRCPNLRLVSSAVNLDALIGQVVELCGSVRLLGNCRTMTVASVNTGVDQLLIGGLTNGQVKLGNSIRFDFRGAPVRGWALLFSGAAGWTPTPVGQLLLRSPYTFVTSGFLDATGQFSLPLRIPNNPSLINANAHFQAGFVDLVKQAFALGNSDCFRIVQ